MAGVVLGLLPGCRDAGDEPQQQPSSSAGLGLRQPAFLRFPSTVSGGFGVPLDTSGFPQRLSEAGVFSDLATLTPVSGLVPYDVQSPLWSDGAVKRRWISVPAGTSIGYGDSDQLEFPPGTVFVKHFELALDERSPELRRRLETRVWIVASSSQQNGVTYRWNEDQTDAELSPALQTEQLSIVGSDGQARLQRYTYPGTQDCQACHNARVGYVLGARLAQLNRPMVYEPGGPATEQLLAWSSWGLFDTPLDESDVELAPRLASPSDTSADLEARVRSYWDGNCSMCHAGNDALVLGWDARFSTPLEEQGVFERPRNPLFSATQLIMPGSPRDSLIYLRGNTTEFAVRMPPIGRNRVDPAYIELLSRWIVSLGG